MSGSRVNKQLKLKRGTTATQLRGPPIAGGDAVVSAS